MPAQPCKARSKKFFSEDSYFEYHPSLVTEQPIKIDDSKTFYDKSKAGGRLWVLHPSEELPRTLVESGKHIISPKDPMDTSHRKRRRLDDGHSKPVIDDVRSSEDLQKLLGFKQDDASELRRNIQAFKIFLESILYGEEETDRASKRRILLTHLQSVALPKEDTAFTPLADVIQTWSFAAQCNHDGLLSAVPAVLALLLKTMSGLIDFRNFGIQLINALLREEQLRLFDRGLTANKSKESLISPCLRLLTEVVSFDGGSQARMVYAKRDTTFKRLEVFLTMRNQPKKEANGDRPRLSVRNIALRFLLSNLRVQDRGTKADILSQSKLIRATFQDLLEDLPETIIEILDDVKKSVILDEGLSRRLKSRLLTGWTLSQLARLYELPEEILIKGGSTSLRDEVHAFLIFVCTTLDKGVLVEQRGWYPPGLERDRKEAGKSGSHPAWTELEVHDRFRERVPVYNMTLASFIQGLRPYANVYHRRLVIAVLNAAPELVADYFFNKRTFAFDAKLSATWVGYASFLFSVVQLSPPDIPDDESPPIPLVLESIMPQPMNEKVLTRCLNQNVELITFSAVQLMIMSFQKLQAILQLWSRKQSDKWAQACSRLVAAFCERCPQLRHAINGFRSLAKQCSMLREALLRLIALYYKTTPQLALTEKFDIPIVLANTLGDIDLNRQHGSESKLQFLELNHLLDIACRSPSINWWHKSGHISLSPFSAILRTYVTTHNAWDEKIGRLLRLIVKDQAILQQHTAIKSFDGLAASLADFQLGEVSNYLYGFLDDCILRFVRKSIKYYGDAEQLAMEVFTNVSDRVESRPISLLLFVILEQWPYFVAAEDDIAVAYVSKWLACYLAVLEEIGEESSILNVIKLRMWERVKEGSEERRLELELYDSARHAQLAIHRIPAQIKSSSCAEASPDRAGSVQRQSTLNKESLFEGLKLPKEDADHRGLNRWGTEDIEMAIEDGAVGELIFCLCSEHGEIRKQALVNIRILEARLKTSSYKESGQVSLLLEEVMESAKPIIAELPFSYFAGAVASRSLKVLSNPLHFMYTKVNKFLNKSPEWKLNKLPSYWISKILLSPPAEDEAHIKEVIWLLDIMIEGLRTSQEMELYRQCGVFERILSCASSAVRSKDCEDKIMQLLYRCLLVGGSTTLVTRFGALSWIRARQTQDGRNHTTLESLAVQLEETCDMSRVHEWSGGGFAKFRI